jgi:tetratricopeptide (TPR) repeat protein
MEIRKSIFSLRSGHEILLVSVLTCSLAGTALGQVAATPGENSGALSSRQESKDGMSPGATSQSILSLADRAFRDGDQKKAIAILARLSENDGVSHFAAGAMLVEHKAYADAAREFGLARKTYKDPYLAGYDETLAYVNAEDFANAIRTANELLNQGYQTAELAEVAASAYRKSGQTQEAYNALRLATHLNPKSEDAYVEMCEIVLEKENYDLGMEIANIGLTNLPNSERLYVQRGVMHAMKGQFGEAQEDFAKSAELAPNEVLPDVALGLIAIQTGHLDQSVQNLRRAAERHPDSYLAQYWLSNALLRSGAAPDSKDGDEMLHALEVSVRLNPNYWHSRADLGKALLERDQVDRAIVELQKASDLNPKATSPIYLLAQAYRKKGETARARELMSRVSTMQTEEREAMPQATLKTIGQGTEGGAADQPKKQTPINKP